MKDSPDPLYMLVRSDEHGSHFLVAATLTREKADAKLSALLAPQRKPHHQSYDIYDYTAETRAALIKRLELKL